MIRVVMNTQELPADEAAYRATRAAHALEKEFCELLGPFVVTACTGESSNWGYSFEIPMRSQLTFRDSQDRIIAILDEHRLRPFRMVDNTRTSADGRGWD